MTDVAGLLDGQFTLGIEEEFQIVHAETRELHSYVSQILDETPEGSILRERVRPEMHQSVVETGTGICKDIRQARDEITELRGSLSALAKKGGMRIVGAGTHPFSDWKTQEITNRERYHTVVEDLQDIARANLVFGLHVHVGIKDKEVAMALANQVRYFLPHILALSTSSPFWIGRLTGLKSTRSEIFKRFPRTGIPGHFESFKSFESFVDLLIKTGCIDNAKKIWWDVRVHPIFETVEIRVCDMPTNMNHTVAVVALVQALMAKLYLLRRQNIGWRPYSRMLIEENKWRATRYGIAGKMIDFGKQKEVPVSDLIAELVDFVDDAAKILGTQDEVRKVERILREGTSAQRQVEVYRKSNGDPKAVVDWLIRETMNGLDDPNQPSLPAGA